MRDEPTKAAAAAYRPFRCQEIEPGPFSTATSVTMTVSLSRERGAFRPRRIESAPLHVPGAPARGPGTDRDGCHSRVHGFCAKCFPVRPDHRARSLGARPGWLSAAGPAKPSSELNHGGGREGESGKSKVGKPSSRSQAVHDVGGGATDIVSFCRITPLASARPSGRPWLKVMAAALRPVRVRASAL